MPTDARQTCSVGRSPYGTGPAGWELLPGNADLLTIVAALAQDGSCRVRMRRLARLGAHPV